MPGLYASTLDSKLHALLDKFNADKQLKFLKDGLKQIIASTDSEYELGAINKSSDYIFKNNLMPTSLTYAKAMGTFEVFQIMLDAIQNSIFVKPINEKNEKGKTILFPLVEPVVSREDFWNEEGQLDSIQNQFVRENKETISKLIVSALTDFTRRDGSVYLRSNLIDFNMLDESLKLMYLQLLSLLQTMDSISALIQSDLVRKQDETNTEKVFKAINETLSKTIQSPLDPQSASMIINPTENASIHTIFQEPDAIKKLLNTIAQSKDAIILNDYPMFVSNDLNIDSSQLEPTTFDVLQTENQAFTYNNIILSAIASMSM